MKPRTLAAALAASFAASVHAGPYDQPYVLFQARERMSAQDLAPATVMKIDGKNVRRGRDEPVAPGKHSVEVSVPGHKGMSNPERQVVEIDAAPCTRYYFAARRSSPTANDWKAYVDAEEPIGECRKKFMK
jgi:hypothetical protein